MHIKGWYRFCSFILCFLFFIHTTYGMMLSADALSQAASLLSRACLGINACRGRTDLEYIQNYLQKHQIKSHEAVYSHSNRSWEYLQLVIDTNKLLVPCGYTLTYEMLSHTPCRPHETVAPAIPAPASDIPTPITVSSEHSTVLQPFNAAIQSTITFKNPYQNITPEQESCFRLQMKLNKSNYDGFNDYQAAYNLRAQHIEQACRQNKEYKKQFIERINYTLQRFLDCNSPNLLTRLDARLNDLTAIAECPLDPPFEFVSQTGAYEFIARYFDSHGALVFLDDDPELLWSIRTLANTRLCGTAYGHWAIADTDTESDWNLILHNVSTAFSNLCRGIRCATGFVPTPGTISSNKDNALLREIIQWCKQEQWDLVVHDNYHRSGVADNPEFICKCIKLLRQQNLNKYKINKLADEDPLWQGLSEQAKKLATNSPEKRQLLSLYFRLRHDLKLQGSNPDELEMSLLASAYIHINDPIKSKQARAASYKQDRESLETPYISPCVNLPETKPLSCGTGKINQGHIKTITCGTATIWLKFFNNKPISCGSSKIHIKLPTRTCGTKSASFPLPKPTCNDGKINRKIYTQSKTEESSTNNSSDSTTESNNLSIPTSHSQTPEEIFLDILKNKPPLILTDDQINELIKQILEEIKKQYPEFDIVDINWKHIIEGEKKKGQLSGYHITCRYPEKIRQILEMPCKHGIYEAAWGQGKSTKTKKSTMFPENWDIATVITKILEAYLNRIKVEDRVLGTCIYGKTIDGITIKIWTNNQKIITAYPEFKIGFFPCCP